MSIPSIVTTTTTRFDKPSPKPAAPKPEETAKLTQDKVQIKRETPVKDAVKGGLVGLGSGVASNAVLGPTALVVSGRLLSLPGMIFGAGPALLANPAAGAVAGVAASRADTLKGSIVAGAVAGAATQAAAAAYLFRGNLSLGLALSPVFLGLGAVTGAAAGAAEHAVNRK